MIEFLVDYIEKKGYTVRVHSGVLLIEKWVGDDCCGYGWAISRYDLHQDMKSCLLHHFDNYIAEQMEECIRTYKG